MEMTTPTSQLPEAHDYLDRVIRELRALKAPQKETLIGVLQYLSDHIRATRAEIGAIRGNGSGDQLFGNTADELEEIVTETARAANRIMDAAETIEGVAGKVDPVSAASLTDAVTQIYEASSFQDITGQRVRKVVETLHQIEARVTRFADAVNARDVEGFANEIERRRAERTASQLLSGPQDKATAIPQDVIDIDEWSMSE